MKEEKVMLKLLDKKKHSVRFDNKESDVVKSLYLMNDAFKRLKEPNVINVSIISSPLVHQTEPDGG